jgi:carboxylesterase type B
VFVSWGESAGAVSVSLQMLANDGNPDGLFRAAVMQSGFPSKTGTGDITSVREQPVTFTELLRNFFFRVRHIMTTS